MKDNLFYKIIRPIVNVLFKIIYRPTIIGNINIPKDKKVILAGNHTNNFDCILLMSSTKRQIHFLAKKELFTGLKSIIFNNLGLIPVDRSKKSHNSIVLAEECLNTNLVVGIFPEGTINRTTDTILPFKKGAVKIASDTNSEIVPFIITGKYKMFKKSIKIEFLKPIKVTNNIEFSNKKLESIIKNKLEEL